MRRKSAVLAGVLSLFPGLGQIYVGYYQKGFLHCGIMAVTIAMLSSYPFNRSDGLTPLLALFLSFFWLYNIIDAARTASLYNDALNGLSAQELPAFRSGFSRSSSLATGLILFVLGFMAFLGTKFDVSMEWLATWWPVVPMIGGAYLVFRGVRERRDG
jgi:hypothetical protein